jgi:hypothetical protein
MKLRVNHLVQGALETDLREAHDFRWRLREGLLDVIGYDAQYRIIWAKGYMFPVTVELELA